MLKYLCLIAISVIFMGCSSMQVNTAWDRTKIAAYNGATDPVTWGTALTSAALYSTDYDTDITDHLMEHHWVNTEDDNLYRNLNDYETLLTAVLIEDNNYTLKGKRVAVELAGMGMARLTKTALNQTISKESPDGTHDEAIGSNHALEPFTSSAMNRRNVEQMSIPTWGKYTLNTLSYATASASALSRVQDGGHSFADQLVSASIGNFLGIFIHDVFMLENTTDMQVSLVDNAATLQLGFKF